MLGRLVKAVVVAVVVTIASLLLGAILKSLTVQIAITIGDWLRTYSSILGILSGLWYFFTEGTWRF